MGKLFVIFCLLFGVSSNSQNFEKIYQERLSNSTDYSFEDIKAYAKSNNAYQFMSLGYFLNANDIMYNKTKDVKYLDLNIQILNTMLIEKNKYNYNDNAWLMDVDSKNQNSWINGKESLTFEGYFFRYVGEFLDIIKTNNLYVKKQDVILSSLENAFDKWLNISEKKYNDASNLFHLRLHIAANWASAALYLYKYTKDNKYNKYKDFYSAFDQQLKLNLKEKKVNGFTCYIWNSTYSTRFTKSLKGQKSYNPEIQDVLHANHIVNYVLVANKIEPSVWTKDDLVKFSNTLAEIIYSNNDFSDDVDGTASKSKELINTGWKQSDGWMKLIPYNSKLDSIYTNYYKNNTSKVNKSTYALQFIANLQD